MDESAEIQDQQVATQFGRWADMDEWFKETRGIKEKTSQEVKTIPVPGEWHLAIYIPMRAEGDYASAMETAMSLLGAMGTRPQSAYLGANLVEDGYFVIWLKPAEFYEVKALAVRVRRWLVSRAFKTTVGAYPDGWRAGVPAHLNFQQDNKRERSKELSMVKRVGAKLTGSAESLTFVLTRGQAEALIDLVGKYLTELIELDISTEELNQILRALDEPLEALGIVLRPGTNDDRGPL